MSPSILRNARIGALWIHKNLQDLPIQQERFGARLKRRFILEICKMNEAEGEAAETQVWLEYAVKCKYLSRDDATRIHKKYDEILGKLISMGNNSDKWVLKIRE